MTKDLWGKTGLHYLAIRKHFKVIEIILCSLIELNEGILYLILAHRLDVNIKDSQDQTFLHILFISGEKEFVIKLIANYMEPYQFNIPELKEKNDEQKQDGESLFVQVLKERFYEGIEKNNVGLVESTLSTMKKSLDPKDFK